MGINRLTIKIAEQSDCVNLDHFSARVIYSKPEERHGADVNAYRHFQIVLFGSVIRRILPSIPLGRTLLEIPGRPQGFAYEFPENRPTVTAPTRILSCKRTAMIAQAFPESRAGADSNNAIRQSVFPRLARFEEKVDTAFWPLHLTGAVSQTPASPQTGTKSIEDVIEFVQVFTTAQCSLPFVQLP
jgi:hypothetical protein